MSEPNMNPLDINAIQLSFAAQQQQFAQHFNSEAAKAYEKECANWAENWVQTGGKNGPPPVAPKKMESLVTFDGGFKAEIRPTTSAVSLLDPWKLVPGGNGAMYPIGAQIPGAPGCYLSTSLGSPAEGEVVVVASRRFVFQKYFFGLGGFWREITNG
jgi:hypothetical protein